MNIVLMSDVKQKYQNQQTVTFWGCISSSYCFTDNNNGQKKIENLIIMQNPFLNTKKYSIVREYDKLQKKTRSQSENVYSRVGTDNYKSSLYGHRNPFMQVTNKCAMEYYPDTQKKYNIQQNYARMHEVQQLRYKTEYSEELKSAYMQIPSRKPTIKQISCKQLSQKEVNTSQNLISRKSMLVNQKSVRSFKDSQAANKKISTIQECDQPLENIRKRTTSIEKDIQQIKPRFQQRKSSLLETMTIIKANYQPNKNQSYQSICELSQNIGSNVTQSLPRFSQQKNSDSQLFGNARDSYSIRKTKINKPPKINIHSGSSRWCEKPDNTIPVDENDQQSSGSSRFSKLSTIFKKQQKNIPDSILVRRKLYFLNKKKMNNIYPPKVTISY